MIQIPNQNKTDLYIGLMSGTSLDGIDAVVVDLKDTPRMIGSHYTPYPDKLRQRIYNLCQPGDNEIQRLGELDIMLGKEFGNAVNQLLKQQSLSASAIKAIGSHGQTIRHLPNHPHRFTLQIGDPNTIAAETGITTVADFRRKDIAVGGQGAPLVPAFHQHVFSSHDTNRVMVNIGGMANITLLPKNPDEPVIGFDTGPGNILLDAWIQQHQNVKHDANGAWANKGKVIPDLLEKLLQDAYFRLPPPKSTGREYFNLAWLDGFFQSGNPEDIQTTLTELTARSIIDAIKQHFSDGEILICGGGASNTYLMSRIEKLVRPNFTVDTTKKFGIEPDWVEAVAFAWLAKQTLNRVPGNLPSVTGSTQATILGGVYYC